MLVTSEFNVLLSTQNNHFDNRLLFISIKNDLTNNFCVEKQRYICSCLSCMIKKCLFSKWHLDVREIFAHVLKTSARLFSNRLKTKYTNSVAC